MRPRFILFFNQSNRNTVVLEHVFAICCDYFSTKFLYSKDIVKFFVALDYHLNRPVSKDDIDLFFCAFSSNSFKTKDQPISLIYLLHFATLLIPSIFCQRSKVSFIDLSRGGLWKRLLLDRWLRNFDRFHIVQFCFKLRYMLSKVVLDIGSFRFQR